MSQTICHIDIGKDFSPSLGPDKKTQGPHSAELFYEVWLEPTYLKYDTIVLNLDNIQIPSMSFFQELFGNLVLKYGLETVQTKIKITAVKNAYLVPKIDAWMKAIK